MHIKAIAAAALAISLAAACATPAGDTGAAPTAIASPAPAPLPAMAGVYGGSYTCVDGEHGFYLNINKATAKTGGGFDVSGVLGLFPTVTGQGGPAGMAAGSFAVSGTIGADGAVTMTPGDWLKQPADYGAAHLEGALTQNADGGYTLRGKPVVPGRPDACNDLIATQFLP